MPTSREVRPGPGRTRTFLAAARDGLDDFARASPARLAVAVFAVIIGVVTGLLMLPASTAGEGSVRFVDALFTATSAVCVTGLVVVDTATYWSLFGQAVILAGILVGGLGVMTLASILGLAVSRHLGLTQRMLMTAEKGTSLGEVGGLLRAVILTSAVVGGTLTLVLFPRYLMLGDDVGSSLWHAFFAAGSIYNNAGFVLEEGGLVPYAGDWWLGLSIVLGTMAGAVGFPVVLNIAARWRTPSRWSLHTKLTLTTYLVLTVGSALTIGLFEWDNVATLGERPVDERILISLVSAVNTRSSGVATIDVGQMRETTWFLQDALMFVGGGSASTAGGIKVTTLAVMVLSIIAEARGDRDVEAFGKRIPFATVRLAVAVAFIGATVVGLGTLLLLYVERVHFGRTFHLDVILFEVISAFATCGLSTGITAELSDLSRYVLVALMFTGRLGTMTVAAALALRDRRRVIRMPEERPIIG